MTCTCTAKKEMGGEDAAAITLLLLAAHVFHRSTSIDERTGLLTFDAWRTWTDPAVTRARHANDHCALLIIDVDGLKKLNDSYGHLAGDSVIVAIARAVRDEVRGHGRDVIGRFGGDEFLVFIDNLPNESDAVVIAERVRRAVDALHVTVGAIGGPATITNLSVSIGVSAVSGARPDRNLTTLLWDADRALYQAKHAGRNAVTAVWDLHAVATML